MGPFSVFRRRQRLKVCPYCGWEILAEAVKCRYCGHFLEDAPAEEPTCRLCGLLAGICVAILLAGLAILIVQAGSR